MAAEAKLEQIYKNYVEIAPRDQSENSTIANTFVDHFIQSLTSGEKPQRVNQGSAAEGLNVSEADEFDFLLAYNFADHRQRQINAVESTTLHDRNLPEIPGYWRLDVVSQVQNQEWVTKWVKREVGRSYLAQDLFRRSLQSVLNSYVESKRYNPHHPSVKYYSDPSIANQAMTVILTKRDGKQISIDISIALNVMVNGREKMFFAQKHGRDVDGLYWSVTRQDREIQVVRNMEPTIKTNYRVAKYLLADVVQSSFILKTAMLHLNQEVSHSKLRTKEGFLKEMIRYLESAYQEQRLLRFFDTSDNILVEYGGQELSDLANEFRRFRNAIEKNDDLIGLIERLLARAKK